VSGEDPTTQELRLEQQGREADEHERAAASFEEDEADQHERRAEKAGYLRQKLEERAEAERAAETDHGRTDGAPGTG
jgi:hypothetical protein